MKIAMTHADLPSEAHGGVAFGVHYLANTLARRGHDVTMFSFSPAFDECRYTVIPLPRKLPRKLQPFDFARALAGVDFSEFDVVHCNGDGSLIKLTRPVLRTFHGAAADEARTATNPLRKVMQLLIARLEAYESRRTPLCVGISRTTRERLPRVKEIIPHGVDISRFTPGPKSPEPSLFFIGTAQGRKRGQWLAELFSRDVLPHVPGATLHAVSDQPLVGQGVINHGRVSSEEIVRLHQQAWAFCLPSTYEGQGIPYLEAMASGTATLASPNPGAREMLEDGKWGIVADDDALAAALVKVLTDEGERRRLEALGLQRAPDFDGEKIAERYEKLYADLAGAHPRAIQR